MQVPARLRDNRFEILTLLESGLQPDAH